MNKIRSFRDFRKDPERMTRLLLLAALFAGSLFIFWEYLFGELTMVFNDIGGDTMQLYTMQFASVVNHIRSGTFSWWDFTHGFGVNLFKLEPFDPGFVLTVGAGVILGPDRMLYVIVWVQVLKILAAGYVFYHYLSSFSFGRQARFAAAFAYGLNGYLLVWGQHYQFGTAVVYFPLLLIGCERYLQNRRGKWIFPVAVFLSGIYSAYFSFMCLAALGLYLLFRVGMEKWSWKQRIRRFFGGCGQILLGLGMSMGLFLPLSQFLLNVSARVGTGETGLLGSLKEALCFYPEKFYESALMRLFSSNLQNTCVKNDGWFEAIFNYYEDPVFFCSTLAVLFNTALLAVFWRAEKEKRTKLAVYSAALLMVGCVILQIGGFVFNGFSGVSNRYTFVLLPFFLLGMTWMWDYVKNKGKVPLVLIAVFTAVMVFVYAVGYKQSIFPEHRLNALILCGTGISMVLCLVYCVRDGEHREWAMRLLLLLLFVNVVSEGRASYETRICIRKSDTPEERLSEEWARYERESNSGDALRVERAERIIPQGYFGALYNQNIQDAITWLKERDSSFFRMEKDFVSATWCMDAQAQGYFGVSSYNSVLNQNVKEFVDFCYPQLYTMDYNHYSYVANVEDNHMAAFLGIRYLISREKELDPSKYERLAQFGDLYVYRNKLPADMGKYFSNGISEKSFKRLYTEETRDRLLEQVIAVEGGRKIKDISELPQNKKGEVVLQLLSDESHIGGHVSAPEDGYVMFMIPFEKGWSLTVDGKEQELFRGDLGFASCTVKKGEHELLLHFSPPGLKEGMVTGALFWILFIFIQFYGRIKEKRLGNRA